MVSLKTKNPFAGGVELFSWKTWVGVGAFTVLAGIVYVGIRAVGGKVESVGTIEELQNRLMGLGA